MLTEAGGEEQPRLPVGNEKVAWGVCVGGVYSAGCVAPWAWAQHIDRDYLVSTLQR